MGLSAKPVGHIVECQKVNFRNSHIDMFDPVVRDFILFCIQRQGNEWPALYDEMCWVAGRRLFRGLGYADLRKLGLSFSLTSLDDTIEMVDTIVAQGKITAA